jgi:hypothetical protein
MKAIKPILTAAVLVVTLAGAAVLDAAERPAKPAAFTPSTALALRFDPSYTTAERAAVTDAIASTRPEAHAILVAISSQVYVTRSAFGGCPSMHMSCVRGGNPNNPSESGRPIVIEYHQEHLNAAGTQLGRFLVLHEFGHAVDAAMLTAPGRNSFMAALHAGSERVGDCRGGTTGCTAIHEQFADEFARWAGRFPSSLSAYGTPALVPTDDFTRLLQHFGRPQSAPDMFGSWPVAAN